MGQKRINHYLYIENHIYILRYFNFEPSGPGNDFLCKRFVVQTLLWSLEFVIEINLEHDTIAYLYSYTPIVYLFVFVKQYVPFKYYAFSTYYGDTDCQIAEVHHIFLNAILERIVTDTTILEAKDKAKIYAGYVPLFVKTLSGTVGPCDTTA